MSQEFNIDSLSPQEMAVKAETIGVRKAALDFMPLLGLSILAGAFIGLGAMFATTVYAGSATLPYGVARLLMGLTFCLGLILVVVAGAELFTGNNLIVMAWASGKVSTMALLRNWLIVYIGNFIGGIGTAGLVFLAKQYAAGTGSVGEVALKIAVSKVALGFPQAVALGILCNGLVCLAVWLTYSARSTTDKIMAIIFPITAFVAAGFEHSVANMYFVPYALFIKAFDPAFAVAHSIDLTTLTWSSFLLKNLLPVTIGNIIGGAGLVAVVYWFIYLSKTKASQEVTAKEVKPAARKI
ncbi:MAG: formate transporter FocA [Anaerolineaceae bacterium]|nr:formate transporter FocA [Anaerolineaceae bacterium]